ncbi:MAG: response regulator [Fibrobacterota bacterium]|nr:response regulator [Fibrobacterota bacterium]QQS04382.1 MAG: response regulator [Fibrobacterota bacterium]
MFLAPPRIQHLLLCAAPAFAAGPSGDGVNSCFGLGLGLVLALAVWWIFRKFSQVQRRRTEHTFDPQALQEVLESLPDAVMLLDREGRVQWVSRSLQSMLGWNLEAIRGHQGLELVHPDDLPRIQPIFQEVLLTPGLECVSEFRAISKDRGPVFVETATQNRLDVPSIRSVVLTAREITERVKARETLQEAKDFADRMASEKAQFLAVLAHEIRTPLQAMETAFRSLETDHLEPAEALELRVLSSRSAKSLLQILDDLLDLSREEARVIPVRSESFDPMDVVSEVAGLFDVPAKDSGGSVTSVCEGGTDHLLGDAARIRQILANLVGNAVRHAPGVPVEVSYKGTQECDGMQRCVWEVRDRGPGLSVQDAAQMFQMWKKGATSRGSGLGLSIVRGLVEVLGGVVEAFPRPGGGLVVRVELPMQRSQGIPSKHPSSDSSTATTGFPEGMKPMVLVAEDDRTNQVVIRRQLENLGCIPIIAADGQYALDEFERGGIDVVLMDCQMPRMDGYQASRAIRQLEARLGTARVPILAVTAWAMQSDKELCLESGMDEVLTKPLRPKVLEAALVRWLAPPRGGQEER